MRDGVVLDLNLDHVLAGAFGALADRFGNFVGLAHVHSDLPLAVTDDNESGKTEATTTFNHLGTAVNEDDLFEEIRTFVLSGTIVTTATVTAGPTTARATSTGTATARTTSAGTTAAGTTSAGTTSAGTTATGTTVLASGGVTCWSVASGGS